MDQSRTPVFDGLTAYMKKQQYSFHVPGHKDGLVFPDQAAPFFKPLLALDATEVADLDDLYHPTGILREAEALLADYYGTKASYFLVNGSTVGNQVMILSACGRGDTVFVQRDSHQSVFNALRLAGVRPVFLAPMADPESGLAAGIDPQAFSAALGRFPEARALILTYPNYYGMAPDVRPIIEAAHRRGMAVLVDEAHGAHFRMGPPVPPSTLDMEADLVVHSAHKMLPAMTMGAWLHVRSSRVPKERVAAVRQMLQTSSPSYVIMASLDLARWSLANLSDDRRKRIFNARDRFAERLAQIPGVTLLKARPGQFLLDPFKITLEASGAGGFAWQKRLIARGIYPELADPHHVLLTLGLTGDIDYSRAVERIRESMGTPRGAPGRKRTGSHFPKWSVPARPFDELATLATEETEMRDAAGRIAAEHVIPYPPGIPVIVQGERITPEHLEAVETWRAAGAVFQNLRAGRGKVVVYRENHSVNTVQKN